MDHFKIDIEPKSKPGYGFARSILQTGHPYRVIFLPHTNAVYPHTKTVNTKSMHPWLVVPDTCFRNLMGALCQVIERLSFYCSNSFALNQLNGYHRLVRQGLHAFGALPAFFYSSRVVAHV